MFQFLNNLNNHNNSTYSNTPQQVNNQQPSNNSLMPHYPYGKFPTQFTKVGQEQLKAQASVNSQIVKNPYPTMSGYNNNANNTYPTKQHPNFNNQPNNTFNTPNNNMNNYNNNGINNYNAGNNFNNQGNNFNNQGNNFNNNAGNFNNQGNNFNLGNLLNSGLNNSNGMDIGSLLPMLSGGMMGKGGNADMMKNLMSMFSGGGSKFNPTDLINLISNGGIGKKSTSTQATQTNKTIDNYKKVN